MRNLATKARLLLAPWSANAMIETPILFLIAFLLICVAVWWFW